MKYVSRAGYKLEHALECNNLTVDGLICADFGSSTGGFVDCLLQKGASKIYAIETGYGVLDWKLRTNNRVVVLEKTNAMHVILPERVGFISIDTSWTKLKNIIPNALANLKEKGEIIALVKPHYEAEKYMLTKGRLKNEYIDSILSKTIQEIECFGLKVLSVTESPILGEKGKNKEYLLFINKGG